MTNTEHSVAPQGTSPSASQPATPQPARHYHLMGIGGIGLSAFARLLHARGLTVSGCDEHPSELTAQLQREGITVYAHHDPAHVQAGHAHGQVDVLIASEAVDKNHPEMLAAKEAGVQVTARMTLLRDLLESGPSVGVVGTHGKTTTTAMLGIAMQGAGLDPSAFVGGIVPEWSSNARVGTGPLVAEVDESDRNFQYIHCDTAVFTNAEDDHIGGAEGSEMATYWHSVEDQHAAFARFIAQSGRVLYCADWQDAQGLGLEHFVAGHPQALSYGTAAGCTYRAANLRPDQSGTTFDVLHQGQKLTQARVNLPGKHNVLNALAALAVTHLYGGDLAGAAAALEAFRGPGRRWQHIGTVGGRVNGALVVDDYAHNATKVAAAISAAQQTGRRVRVVFQPHRYLRTQQSWPRLAQSLMNADEVLLLDIAAASEAPIAGVHSTLISDQMRGQGHQAVQYYPQREEAVTYLRATAQPGDIIVTMGAGDVWKLARQLVEAQLPIEAQP